MIPILGIGVLLGCGEGEGRVATPMGPIAVYEAPAETVIVQVGDTKITVGDFRRRFDFEKGLYTFRNAKDRDCAKKFAKIADQRQQQYVAQLVHDALLNDYLDSACGGRDVADADRAIAKFLRHGGAKASKLGFEGLAKEIGVDAAYLRDEALRSAREEKASLVFDPGQTTVSENEIDEGLARLDAAKARIAATNTAAWAACSNALQAVKAGAEFATVGRKFGAEDTQEAIEWGWFSREDFDMMAKRCPALKRWAFTAKVGEIGGPFDMDDGLSIIKVVGHQEGSEKASMASKQTEEVQLVRINFLMAEENTEPRTREHCREALLVWKRQDAQTRLFTKLFNEAKIAYPNGGKLDFKGRK